MALKKIKVDYFKKNTKYFFPKLLILIFVMPLFTLQINAQVRVVEESFLKKYANYDTTTFNFEEVFNTLKNGNKHVLVLNLKRYGNFKIEISPSNIELENASRQLVFDNRISNFKKDLSIFHWQGIVSKSVKTVRLNVYSDKMSGYLELDSGLLYLETIKISGQTKLLIYHSSELKKEDGINLCGLKNENQLEPNQLNKKTETYEKFSCAIIKIASVASYSLFKQNKYDTLATLNSMKDIINMADGVYSKYIGVRLKISSISISLDSQTYFNYSSSIVSRLDDFNAKRQQFTGTITPDVYHLFTETFNSIEGADGVAHLATSCNSKNVAISINKGDIPYRTVIFCHELGHNLNANHGDGFFCGTSTATIMCSNSGNTLVFGSKEIGAIQKFISDKLKIAPPTSCFTYPVSIANSELNLCQTDSVLLLAEPIKGFHSYLFYENKLLDKWTDKPIDTWIKNAGTYKIKYTTDTVNSVYCYLEKEIYTADNNYEVTQTMETGFGSLKYAILNSNGCAGTDTIKFNLKEPISTFNLTKVLPPIIDNCIIDGTSQKNFYYPDKYKIFRPGIIINSKLPFSTYSKYGLLLGRGRYNIKGLEINNFETAITNDLYSYKNTIYSHLAPSLQGNPFMETVINSCKFIGNYRAIYLVMDDSTKNNDRILIGDGTLKNANFFLGSTGNSCRIAYADWVTINGNYYGVEPMIDTISTNYSGIVVNQCKKAEILNNSICNSRLEAIGSIGSAGKIQNNSIGLNPFNNKLSGFSGIGVSASNNLNNPPMVIGGLGVSEGNVFYNQKKVYKTDAAFLNYGDNGIIFIGNKSINPDTTSINFYFPDPIKIMILDSSAINCTTNKKSVYGKIAHRLLNDTLHLHFYSTPDLVKNGFEPIHTYLGAKTIFVSDTNEISFSQILDNCKLNEGVIMTATSQKMNFTSQLSNVIYTKNRQPFLLTNLADTTLCPSKSITLNLNSKFSDFTLNGVSVNTGFKIIKPGYYEVTAKDAKGCLISQSQNVSYYPNYLFNAKLTGPDYYSWAKLDTFYVVDYYNPKKWGNYKWSAENGYVDNLKQFEASVALVKDTAILNYQITDINTCTYSLSKTLFHNVVGINNPAFAKQISIFPNPSDGIFKINLKNPEQMILYNSMGEKLKSFPSDFKNGELDISEFSSGLYFLFIENYGFYKLMKN